mmetsp:Transcript_95898/g.207020  ORF Transcript_95898/g.207020 Transcript_95898/m.207020 type:complete len:84 (+) Transcript_95898:1015-1266(+)
MNMLSKWLETADEDQSKKDDETSSQDTSKKSTVKHSFKKKQNDKVSDDPRSKREDYEKEYWYAIDIPVERTRVWNCLDSMLNK